jgi:multisubunit Na+/H+ antiporter MnhC subunit
MDVFLLTAAVVAVGIVAVYLTVSIRLERSRRVEKGVETDEINIHRRT